MQTSCSFKHLTICFVKVREISANLRNEEDISGIVRDKRVISSLLLKPFTKHFDPFSCVRIVSVLHK